MDSYTIEPASKKQTWMGQRESAEFLASWMRVVAPDGSTVAYAPDATTAQWIADQADWREAYLRERESAYGMEQEIDRALRLVRAPTSENDGGRADVSVEVESLLTIQRDLVDKLAALRTEGGE